MAIHNNEKNKKIKKKKRKEKKKVVKKIIGGDHPKTTYCTANVHPLLPKPPQPPPSAILPTAILTQKHTHYPSYPTQPILPPACLSPKKEKIIFDQPKRGTPSSFSEILYLFFTRRLLVLFVRLVNRSGHTHSCHPSPPLPPGPNLPSLFPFPFPSLLLSISLSVPSSSFPFFFLTPNGQTLQFSSLLIIFCYFFLIFSSPLPSSSLYLSLYLNNNLKTSLCPPLLFPSFYNITFFSPSSVVIRPKDKQERWAKSSLANNLSKASIVAH